MASNKSKDFGLCKSCLTLGQHNQIKIFQINLEEAIWMCPNPKCVYPIGTPSMAGLVVTRNASDISNIKRKNAKMRSSLRQSHNGAANLDHPFHPLGSAPETSSVSVDGSECGNGKVLAEQRNHVAKDSSSTAVNTNFNANLCSYPSVKSYLQWQNIDNLCWLDVSLKLLVQCTPLRLLLETLTYKLDLVITKLINTYDKAQELWKSCTANVKPTHQSMTGSKKSLLTSVGAVPVHTGGGHVCNALYMEPDLLRSKLDALTMLSSVREDVWKFIHPRLKCERGQTDSPVFALPHILEEDPFVQQAFTCLGTWHMTCSICNHEHKKKVERSVLTFPSVSAQFSFDQPSFPCVCMKCKAPDQVMHLSIHRYADAFFVHFVEGLPKKDITNYDFHHKGSRYLVRSVVQYKTPPNHFVAWIRDPHAGLWMECDDMKSAQCSFSAAPPAFLPQDIHMIMCQRENVGHLEPSSSCPSTSQSNSMHAPVISPSSDRTPPAPIIVPETRSHSRVRKVVPSTGGNPLCKVTSPSPLMKYIDPPQPTRLLSSEFVSACVEPALDRIVITCPSNTSVTSSTKADYQNIPESFELVDPNDSEIVEVSAIPCQEPAHVTTAGKPVVFHQESCIVQSQIDPCVSHSVSGNSTLTKSPEVPTVDRSDSKDTSALKTSTPKAVKQNISDCNALNEPTKVGHEAPTTPVVSHVEANIPGPHKSHVATPVTREHLVTVRNPLVKPHVTAPPKELKEPSRTPHVKTLPTVATMPQSTAHLLKVPAEPHTDRDAKLKSSEGIPIAVSSKIETCSAPNSTLPNAAPIGKSHAVNRNLAVPDSAAPSVRQLNYVTPVQVGTGNQSVPTYLVPLSSSFASCQSTHTQYSTPLMAQSHTSLPIVPSPQCFGSAPLYSKPLTEATQDRLLRMKAKLQQSRLSRKEAPKKSSPKKSKTQILRGSDMNLKSTTTSKMKCETSKPSDVLPASKAMSSLGSIIYKAKAQKAGVNSSKRPGDFAGFMSKAVTREANAPAPPPLQHSSRPQHAVSVVRKRKHSPKKTVTFADNKSQPSKKLKQDVKGRSSLSDNICGANNCVIETRPCETSASSTQQDTVIKLEISGPGGVKTMTLKSPLRSANPKSPMDVEKDLSEIIDRIYQAYDPGQARSGSVAIDNMTTTSSSNGTAQSYPTGSPRPASGNSWTSIKPVDHEESLRNRHQSHVDRSKVTSDLSAPDMSSSNRCVSSESTGELNGFLDAIPDLSDYVETFSLDQFL